MYGGNINFKYGIFTYSIFPAEGKQLSPSVTLSLSFGAADAVIAAGAGPVSTRLLRLKGFLQ